MLSNVQKIVHQFTGHQFSFQLQPSIQPQLLFASPQWQAQVQAQVPTNYSSGTYCNLVNVATTRVSLPRKAKESGTSKRKEADGSKGHCKCGNNAASACSRKSCAKCCQDPKCPKIRHRNNGLTKYQLAHLATADYLSNKLPAIPPQVVPSGIQQHTGYCVTTSSTPTTTTPSRLPSGRDIITYSAPKAKPQPKDTHRTLAYILPQKASLTSTPVTNAYRLLEKESDEKDARVRSMFYVRFPLKYKCKQKDFENIFKPYCQLKLIEWLDTRSAYVTISDDATFGTYDTIYLNLVMTSNIENEGKTYVSPYSEVLKKHASSQLENVNKKRKRSDEEETVNKKHNSEEESASHTMEIKCFEETRNNSKEMRKGEEENDKNTRRRKKSEEEAEQEEIWNELEI